MGMQAEDQITVKSGGLLPVAHTVSDERIKETIALMERDVAPTSEGAKKK